MIFEYIIKHIDYLLEGSFVYTELFFQHTHIIYWMLIIEIMHKMYNYKKRNQKSVLNNYDVMLGGLFIIYLVCIFHYLVFIIEVGYVG